MNELSTSKSNGYKQNRYIISGIGISQVGWVFHKWDGYFTSGMGISQVGWVFRNQNDYIKIG